MPHIDVSLYPGRGMEIKEPLAKKIEQLFIEELGCNSNHISVTFTDTNPETFTEDVLKKVSKENIIIESDLIKK